jgi:hypothetical protein
MTKDQFKFQPNHLYTKTINKLKRFGLEITSTKKQIANGTIQVFDPISKREFAIYESGYVRVFTGRSIFDAPGTKRMYQINPKFESQDAERPWTSYKRILYPGGYSTMAKLLIGFLERNR